MCLDKIENDLTIAHSKFLATHKALSYLRATNETGFDHENFVVRSSSNRGLSALLEQLC
jgi:hypothetical protein